MLSRTAEGLFWLGRYTERAENIARLLEAGWRFDQMPTPPDAQGNEWSAILTCAGCSETFEGDLQTASAAEAIRHLMIDPKNPSSIVSCFSAARTNARAQRVALTTDLWMAVNDAWRDVRELTDAACFGHQLMSQIDTFRAHAALIRGTAEGTLLRNAGYNFLQLGLFIERADATARLLDVKYHTLLPGERKVGGGYDQLQWNHVLRSAGARASYRWVYQEAVRADLVVDYLLFNRQSPRSVRYCYDALCKQLKWFRGTARPLLDSLELAEAMRGELDALSANAILEKGLHEYLTRIIARTFGVAQSIARDFDFEGPEINTASQSQAQL